MNSITTRNYKKIGNNITRKLFRGGEEVGQNKKSEETEETEETEAAEETEETEPVTVQEDATEEVSPNIEAVDIEEEETVSPEGDAEQESAEPIKDENKVAVQDAPETENVETAETTVQSEEGESGEIQAFRNSIRNPETQRVYFYMNTNISTEENRDKSYKREGVLHLTDSVSVGSSQNTIMSLGTVIGNRGIETSTYDKLRNVALQKVGILLGETRRCYNTKIDFERNGETIFVHIYGTIYSKKESTV